MLKMKKIAKLLVFISLLTPGFTFSQSEEINITGKWEDKELHVEYDFSSTNTASFSQMGYGMSVSYEVDFSKSPYWIDFTLQRAGNKMKMLGLLRIINKDTIWIEQFSPGSKHPTKFSKDFISRTRKIHVLVRKKP